jgi:hypothetical protein
MLMRTQYQNLKIMLSFLFLFFCLFICAYIVWAISPPYSKFPPSPPNHPSLPGRICSAPISNFVEERILNNNKKDQSFLLVELRRVIQRDS